MIVNGGNEKMKNYTDDGFPRYQRTRKWLTKLPNDRPTDWEVGNILEEFSLVYWAGGRYALIYTIPLFPTFFRSGCNFGNNFWSFTASALSNRNSRVICYFVTVSVSQPVFKDLEAQFKEQTEEFETTKKSIVGKKVACVQLLFPLLFAEKGCNERNTRRLCAG